jgi:hypothetical protein
LSKAAAAAGAATGDAMTLGRTTNAAGATTAAAYTGTATSVHAFTFADNSGSKSDHLTNDDTPTLSVMDSSARAR